VTSVAFRPEGKALASSGQGKTLKLWDVARGQEQATPRGHADTIASAALSPAHTCPVSFRYLSVTVTPVGLTSPDRLAVVREDSRWACERRYRERLRPLTMLLSRAG
jgi:WD40 repeat protein